MCPKYSFYSAYYSKELVRASEQEQVHAAAPGPILRKNMFDWSNEKINKIVGLEEPLWLDIGMVDGPVLGGGGRVVKRTAGIHDHLRFTDTGT